MIKMMVMQEVIKVKNKAKAILSKKLEGADGIVIALVLVAVGVGLSIYFRNGIYTMITNAVTSLTSTLNSLFKGIVTT